MLVVSRRAFFAGFLGGMWYQSQTSQLPQSPQAIVAAWPMAHNRLRARSSYNVPEDKYHDNYIVRIANHRQKVGYEINWQRQVAKEEP